MAIVGSDHTMVMANLGDLPLTPIWPHVPSPDSWFLLNLSDNDVRCFGETLPNYLAVWKKAELGERWSFTSQENPKYTMKHPFLSRLASHFVPKLTGRVQRTATWPGVRDGWTDWPIWEDYQYVCCICVCACLHKTAYHYCITCTRYIKLLHSDAQCRNM